MIDATRHPRWPEGVALALAGDGQMRERIRDVQDDRTIRYLGRLPHAEVPAFLAGAIASLCVQTATGGRGDVGCSPIKLYEGLAAGRPVIASDMPGVGNVVDDAGGGVIVPPGDAGAVAEAVASLTADRDAADAMGSRAREAAVREHSWHARARATDAFLLDLLSAR
jgi:glycosyltransferase involved in cell wall biosynthesis